MQHTCPFCHSLALRRVRRTLWERCVYRRVYKCRCCGRLERLVGFFSFGDTRKGAAEREVGRSGIAALWHP